METPEAPPAPGRNGEPLLRAEGVWKLFGKNADKVIGTPDADLPARRAPREDRLRRRRARRQHRRLARRGVRGHGPLRLRQVHARPHADPADRAHRRHGQDRRPGRDRLRRRRAARAAPAQGVDGVPALRAARPPHGDRQRRVRARDPGRVEGRAARGAPTRCSSSSASHDVATSFPSQLSGGMQQRVGPRAGVRGRARADALRRAVQRARSADPPRHAGRGDPAPGRDRARRWSSSPTTSPRRSGSATASRSCATARSCSSARPRSSWARPPTGTWRTSSATSRAPTC